MKLLIFTTLFAYLSGCSLMQSAQLDVLNLNTEEKKDGACSHGESMADAYLKNQKEKSLAPGVSLNLPLY